MLVVMDQFTSWMGENLEICSIMQYSPERSCISSPRVTLEYQDGTLSFKTWAPWWKNPAPDGPPRSLWGLWEYEVIEFFIEGAGGRYLEVEINPYGHYLALMLKAPRQIERKDLTISHLECLRRSSQTILNNDRSSWSSQGIITSEQLPVPYHDEEMIPYWRINSFWCFSRGDQRYHCCAHSLPGPHPDFHQPQHFPSWVLC